MNKVKSPRVVVAMSGGVDSSVAAALLVERGYDVVGMMMKLWSDPAMGGEEFNRCCTPQQMSDARRVADKLGIPFYVLDTKDVFREKVVTFYIDSHQNGFTPNPCMECNRHIRFDYLQKNALALDADYLATGHYARIVQGDGDSYRLLKGIDDNKDQSYVLSVMGQEQLSRALFPVGEYPKQEVRALAKKFGLNVESKKDSQDLCFLGGRDYREFLGIHAPEIMEAGPIVFADGEQIGEHQGLANYTIGQRKGLGVNYSEPLFVIAMNPYRNALIVGTRDQLGQDRLIANRFNWVQGSPPDIEFDAEVKIRYKAKAVPAHVAVQVDKTVHIRFDEPLRDITPGQGAVIYQGDECLGGGIIEKAPSIIQEKSLTTQ